MTRRIRADRKTDISEGALDEFIKQWADFPDRKYRNIIVRGRSEPIVGEHYYIRKNQNGIFVDVFKDGKPIKVVPLNDIVSVEGDEEGLTW